MPTIAEILAAKKAGATATAAAGKPATYAAAAKPETLAERAATKAAIDAIDPPGKSAAAAAARKMTGLILNKDMPCPPKGEPRGQATPVRGPEDIQPRSLGASEGEAIDVTPLAADQCIKDWHKAVSAFSTELVIMRDPVDPERAWLAVRLEEEPLHPLLLKDLPIYDHPRAFRKPNEPF
jgi:hypothetical protein